MARKKTAPSTIVVEGHPLQIWKGPAYRAPSGYTSAQSAGEEAAEYLEQQILSGYELEPWQLVLGELVPLLHRADSAQMYWVTKRRKDAEPYAERYGEEIERFDHLDGNAVILGDDEEGGYLILEDYRLFL